MPRTLTEEFTPLLRLGQHVVDYMPGYQSKQRQRDPAAAIQQVIHQSPIPRKVVNLGAIAAASASLGASGEGAKLNLKRLLELPDNVLAQVRIHPGADFRIEVYQPDQHFRVFESEASSLSWASTLDPRGNPMHEFFHKGDYNITMRALNDHRVALPTTPVVIYGWAYRLAPKPIEQVLVDMRAKAPDKAAGYERDYRDALASTGSVVKAQDMLITRLIAEGALNAPLAVPEATF